MLLHRFRLRAIGSIGPLVYPAETRHWIDFLKNNVTLLELARTYPRLALKIYRPYVTKSLTCSERVLLLRNHYKKIVDSGFIDFVSKTAIHPQNICDFLGKNGTNYHLYILGMSFDREGELNLRLISNGLLLYNASFVFQLKEGEYFIKVGCLQGVRSREGASHVKTMTRDLYDCRPKNFMAAVVRDIGNYFGCKTMVMVSNENRVKPSKLLFWRRAEIMSDYDQTWVEMGAIKRDDGNYELPCSDILKINFDDIPSRKRSALKKRNALLESIFQSVRHSLNEARSKEASQLMTVMMDDPLDGNASYSIS